MLKGMNKKERMIVGLLIVIIVCALMGILAFPGKNNDADEEYTDNVSATPAAFETVTPAEEVNNDITPTPTAEPEKEASPTPTDKSVKKYSFANKNLLDSHFKKHGEEFPYKSKVEYVEGANRVINNPDSLHKLEAEDGDDIYYLEATNEFVVVSKSGYIRTYFKPSAGKAYYDRQ